jgi:hypothetical protein
METDKSIAVPPAESPTSIKDLKKREICGKEAKIDVSNRQAEHKCRMSSNGGSIHTRQKRHGQDQLLHKGNRQGIAGTGRAAVDSAGSGAGHLSG